MTPCGRRSSAARCFETHHPVHVAFHEYVALWYDLRRVPDLRARARSSSANPGYQPEGAPPVESTQG